MIAIWIATLRYHPSQHIVAYAFLEARVDVSFDRFHQLLECGFSIIWHLIYIGFYGLVLAHIVLSIPYVQNRN